MKMHSPRFADERYAAQRQTGFSVLRFEPDLEQEYRTHFIGQSAGRLRASHAFGIVALLGFIAIDFLSFQFMPALATAILLLVALPALVLPLVATFIHEPGQTIQRYVFYCSLLLGLGLVAAFEVARAASPAFPYEGVLLLVMYVYLLSGLLFLQATLVGWGIVATYMFFELQVQDVRPNFVYEMFYLVVGNILGMIGVYVVQYESRRSFLLQCELWMRAVLDPLTGALNRREFLNQLDTAWAVAQRQKVALGVLLVDVDNFKAINDTHGHPVGDEMLRAVGDVLKASTLRPLDAAGRYGGDEFIALWFDVPQGWIETMAAGMPKRLADFPLTGAAEGVKLSVSGGAVRVEPRPGLLPQDAINLADLKLYEQKRAGRGTIATAVLLPVAARG